LLLSFVWTCAREEGNKDLVQRYLAFEIALSDTKRSP
jgi:hypothetical protein